MWPGFTDARMGIQGCKKLCKKKKWSEKHNIIKRKRPVQHGHFPILSARPNFPIIRAAGKKINNTLTVKDSLFHPQNTHTNTHLKWNDSLVILRSASEMNSSVADW